MLLITSVKLILDALPLLELLMNSEEMLLLDIVEQNFKTEGTQCHFKQGKITVEAFQKGRRGNDLQESKTSTNQP